MTSSKWSSAAKDKAMNTNYVLVAVFELASPHVQMLSKCPGNVVVSVSDANSGQFSIRVNDLCTRGGGKWSVRLTVKASFLCEGSIFLKITTFYTDGEHSEMVTPVFEAAHSKVTNSKWSPSAKDKKK